MYREPIAMGRKLTQINGVDQKEERNIQPEKTEETRIQTNEERLNLGTSRTSLNVPTSEL